MAAEDNFHTEKLRSSVRVTVRSHSPEGTWPPPSTSKLLRVARLSINSKLYHGSHTMNPLTKTDHRPWPLPSRPWIMVQVWRDLLFAHWRLPAETIRPFVPQWLELDTFDGHAWVSIAPFHMSLRARGLPMLPWMSMILETNFRTYVVAEEKPGILFFSLDASSVPAVYAARWFYHLPYFHASMGIERDGNSFSYSLRRGQVAWRVDYGPAPGQIEAPRGSLEHCLTERYCLYTEWQGRAYRGQIHHMPWPLQHASVTIHDNTLPKGLGLALPATPDLASVSPELEVMVWPLERVGLPGR